ncbi:MAG: hypothetical protein AAFS10_11160, partial [Myxococcota bacterium]
MGMAPDTEVTPDTEVVPDTAPPMELPPEIVAVNTRLSAERVDAGTIVTVTCIALDGKGDPVNLDTPPLEELRTVPATLFGEATSGELRPIQVGDATVACALPELRLFDPTPALLEVVPGPPHTVLAELDQHTAQAGEWLGVTCTTLDAFGNRIDDADLRVLTDPFGEGITVEGFEVNIERAGQYTITCATDGATELIGDVVEVGPSNPSEMLVGLAPVQEFYGLGQVVEAIATVTDVYGNPMDIPVTFTSEPAGIPFGRGRFRYNSDGNYTILAELERGDNIPPLRGSVELIVNGSGPSIECTDPADSGYVTVSEGSPVTVNGVLADANGIGSLRVNNNEVNVHLDGTFQVEVPARFGINFLDIAATDRFGLANSTTCAFMAASSWAEEQTFIDDMVTLRLNSSAIDDGNRSDRINSLGDLLHGALNSQGLFNTLDDSLSVNGGRLRPFTCDGGRFCPLPNPFGGCFVSEPCWAGFGMTYERLENRGSNTASLALVNDGLAATARLSEFWLRMRLEYELVGIRGSTSGWVKVRNTNVGLQFSLS